MIRLFDITFSIIGLLFFSPIILSFLILGSFVFKSPLFFQLRLGKNKKEFTLIKFRTMHRNMKSMPTHLVKSNSINLYGRILRKTKIDELPQLLNVIKGDMSLVGPRPNLITQRDLIFERSRYNLYSIKPGITGLAQIKGVDMSSPKLLAKFDYILFKKMNLFLYFKIIIYTILGKGFGDRISK